MFFDVACLINNGRGGFPGAVPGHVLAAVKPRGPAYPWDSVLDQLDLLDTRLSDLLFGNLLPVVPHLRVGFRASAMDTDGGDGSAGRHRPGHVFAESTFARIRVPATFVPGPRVITPNLEEQVTASNTFNIPLKLPETRLKH